MVTWRTGLPPKSGTYRAKWEKEDHGDLLGETFERRKP